MERDSSDLRTVERTRVAVWLLCVCAMIYVMVLLGGITRLTYSGLSMVDWKPFSGWLPPLNAQEWEAVFAQYRDYPEYKELNAGMSLAEFKSIFWIEFIHRFWGRLIGVVFLVPFIFFFLRGWIGGRDLPKFLLMGVLGALQGVLGWYMVKSGLVDHPDVSPYRLTAHLGLAIFIYAFVLWAALELLRLPEREGKSGWFGAFAPVVLIFVTIISGGFMAGSAAGFGYNTFPTMDGEWLPEGLYALEPFYANFALDITTVQFNHRILAYCIVALVFVYWAWVRATGKGARLKFSADLLLGAALAQATLGVATLLLLVPVPVALLHQAGAVALLSIAVWNAVEILATEKPVPI
ncbi:MAG: heme A synthase [Rhodospirillales bacterium]|jgi:heme a synthase|nr:heme A synthase [Rhodospirillales bacterium]